MISAIANGLSNSTLANITQNTAARVSIETTLKSIGRPGFILIDNDISEDTKKYASAKEFLYQAICLVVYLAVIPPIFKNSSYKLGKKYFGKTHPEFYKFKNMSEYLQYYKYASKNLNERKESLTKIKPDNKFMQDVLREDLLSKEKPEKYNLIKGTVEAGTFIGSIIGLAILAPQISHHMIHPIMRFFNFEKDVHSEKNV